MQRALEDGVSETGVSVAYTVLRCDAGPVLAQRRVAVDPEVQVSWGGGRVQSRGKGRGGGGGC